MKGDFQTLEKRAAKSSSDWKSYPAYKDSGVPWLDKVPEHWELRPAFGAYFPTLERNKGMKEKTVLSLSYGRIIVKPVEKLHGLVPESFETYQIVNPGDIVLRTTDLQNDHTSLRVGKVENRGIITSAYLNLRVKEGVNPNYGYQFLNVWDTTKAIYGFGSGLRQNLDFTHFKRMPVSVPPPPEQAAIVKFLGHQEGMIRRYIRSKQKLIALLTEQKQAIIQRAVTRGLNPDVKLKPSGVDWLGDIPEHWEVSQLNRIAMPRSERGRPDLPLLSVVREKGIILREGQTKEDNHNYIPDDLSNYKVVKMGDLAVNKMKAWQGSMGISSYTGIVSPAYFVFNITEPINNGYLHLLMRSRPFIGFYNNISEGVRVGQWDLNIQQFRRTPILVPPPDEQSSIVEHVERSLLAITQQISIIERQISLMQEYRTRLISDVVTGKVDVRELAKDLPEPEEVVDSVAESDVEEVEEMEAGHAD